MRSLEASGWLHPLPSGTCQGTWGGVTALSWGDFLLAEATEIRVLQESKDRMVHTWLLITQSHFYILFGMI